MIAQTTLVTMALLYVGLLFLVALYADRLPRISARVQPLIYALSLSVYCSSWTFYGAVGSASNSPWQHVPIYLGPILLYVFAWPLIQRLLTVGSRQRVTSIADFIGARYGKNQSLAAIVTLVAAATVLPYIALQLKALSQSWAIISSSGATQDDSALFAATIMAIFTILFGARRLDGRERHRGVMAAIATESLVKLLAFIAVAGLATSYLVKRLSLVELSQVIEPWESIPLDPDFIAQVLISMLAILCLPRQFHVTVVEYQDPRDSRLGRWLFPGYLAAFMFLVVPISIAGQHLFATRAVNPDIYVQLLPMVLDQKAIAIAAFIGGISAATGMVIVATVSLAIMVTNELVAPILIRVNTNSPRGLVRLGDSLRHTRRISIAAIFVLAWLVERQLATMAWLTDIGFLSFLAAAQLSPSLIAGLYWRKGNAIGVIAGIVAGLFIWFYVALLPQLLHDGHTLLQSGLFELSWLRPGTLLGWQSDYPLAQATFSSLLLNTGIFVVISLLARPSIADRRQTKLFLDTSPNGDKFSAELDFSRSPIRVSQLQALLSPFMGEDQCISLWHEFETLYSQRLLPGDRAPQFVVARVEALLAGIIGATSAHRALLHLEETQQLDYRDFAGMVSEASAHNQFNRELLQTTVETINQGISVVDKSLKLVAWNKSYERLFDYPERFLYVGCPIERVYRFNAERGLMAAEGDYDSIIENRLDLLYAGSDYRLERVLPNGRVVDIRGTPMPHGGFVTTYSDITEHKEMLNQIEEARLVLEQRVQSGSRVLAETNVSLRRENRLRAEAETRLREAHISKSRFMSATSHDLLQPINAARLFTAALQARHQEHGDPEIQRFICSIDSSLAGAEALLAALREIARLDSGKQAPQRINFSAKAFIDTLANEFQMTAQAKGLTLRSRSCEYWLYSDPHLLRRIVQNFLSNAIRYTTTGKVLLGCRRRHGGLRIEVWDTGPGIPESEHVRIFAEFERLQSPGTAADEGLGLGLAIARRCANMLGHPVDLRSSPGRGTLFAITVPGGHREQETGHDTAAAEEPGLRDILALCIDNDRAILEGMQQLLSAWGCKVRVEQNWNDTTQWREDGPPTIILADYHLGLEETGLDAVIAINSHYGDRIPAIIISADDSELIRDSVKSAGYHFMAKPVNPGRLKAMIRGLIDARESGC